MPFNFKSVVLGWLVGEDDANRILATDGKSVISEDMVRASPLDVSPAILDDRIAINKYRQFFYEDAWLLVEDLSGF